MTAYHQFWYPKSDKFLQLEKPYKYHALNISGEIQKILCSFLLHHLVIPNLECYKK